MRSCSLVVKRGFTLLEMLIALVVFAFAATTISSTIGGASSQLFNLERQTLASWVAQNHFAELRMARRLSTDPIPVGTKINRVIMGGHEWQLDTQTTATSNPWLRRVELNVSARNKQSGQVSEPVLTLVGFVGRY